MNPLRWALRPIVRSLVEEEFKRRDTEQAKRVKQGLAAVMSKDYGRQFVLPAGCTPGLGTFIRQ